MARLRRIEGVQRVSVASSDKLDQAASGTSDSAGDGSNGCQTTAEVPQFQMVVFFGAPQAAASQDKRSGIQGAIQTLNEGTAGTTSTPAPATPGS